MKHFVESYNLLLVLTGVTGLVILLKCACALAYQTLIGDAKKLPNAKNKQLCSMCARFEAGYKLRLPMHSTDCFVRQQMEQERLWKIPLQSLASLDCLCAVLVTAAVLFSILLGIYDALSARFLLIQAMTLVCLLSFLALSELFFGVRRRKNRLYLQLVHYFENNLRPRLEKEYLHPQETQAYQNSYFEEEVEELRDAILQEETLDDKLEQQRERLQAAATTEKLKLVEDIIKTYIE